MFLCKVWPKNKLGILILSDTLNKYIYNTSKWKRTMTNGIDLCWKLSLIFFHSVSYGHSKQQDYSPLSFCLLSMANGHVFTSCITKVASWFTTNMIAFIVVVSCMAIKTKKYEEFQSIEHRFLDGYYIGLNGCGHSK